MNRLINDEKNCYLQLHLHIPQSYCLIKAASTCNTKSKQCTKHSDNPQGEKEDRTLFSICIGAACDASGMMVMV